MSVCAWPRKIWPVEKAGGGGGGGILRCIHRYFELAASPRNNNITCIKLQWYSHWGPSIKCGLLQHAKLNKSMWKHFSCMDVSASGCNIIRATQIHQIFFFSNDNKDYIGLTSFYLWHTDGSRNTGIGGGEGNIDIHIFSSRVDFLTLFLHGNTKVCYYN